jgi:hypothetical protein
MATRDHEISRTLEALRLWISKGRNSAVAQRNLLQKQGDGPFGRELRSVVESVSRCFSNVRVGAID